MTAVSSSVRRALVCLGAGLALVAGAARAQEIAVAPSQADEALATLAPGLDHWLRTALEGAGVGAPAVPADGAFARAAEQGFTKLIVPRLSRQEGEARVDLLLYAPDTEALLLGTSARASTAEVGRAAVEALARMLPQIGGAAGDLTPPLLDELVSTSRALRARERGDLLAAWRAVQGKLSPAAMRLRDEINEQARSSSTPSTRRARVLAAQGDTITAWGLIGRRARAALDESSPDPELMTAAGEVMLLQGALPEARRYFSAALATDPGRADARIGLAKVLAQEGESEAARGELIRASELDASSARPLEELARIETDPSQQAARWIQAGRRSAMQLDVRRARRQLGEAKEITPEAAPEADEALGELEERLGRPQKARVAYQRAVQGGRRTPQVLTALGRSEHRTGDAAAAEKSLRRALEIEPKHPAALRELGAVYADTGRTAEAVPMLRTAHEIEPENARTRLSLARALRATGDADEALALLSGAPSKSQPEHLAEVAEIQAERGELEAARATLARAVELEPGNAGLRSRFADVLEKVGDAAAAMAERQRVAALGGEQGGGPGSRPQRAAASVLSLDDLVTSFAVQLTDPRERRIAALGVREPRDWKARLLRLVRPRSVDLDAIDRGLQAAVAARFDSASVAKEADDALSLHIDRLYDFDEDHSLNAETIATLNQVLAIDGAFLVRLVAQPEGEMAEACGSDAFAVEMRLLLGRNVDTASILSNYDCLEGGFEAYGAWNPVAFVLYALAALLAGWPLIRGWGQIVVRIELPERTKGFFSIHITTRPDQVKREVNDKTRREKSKGSRFDFLQRYQRHMAGKETVFRMIPARRAPYTVTCSGPLMDARGEEIIGHFLEEKRVTVRRRRASKVDFDFRPKEVAVEVTVKWDGQPARDARVGIQGDPSSLRYARDGVAFLYLGRGSYTVLVGCGGAAAQFEIEVASLEKAIPLQVDMGRAEGLVFSDCPDAVEPYLQSDLASAARALDDAGNERAAHLLRAELYRQQGRGEEAAEELRAAGELSNAATQMSRDANFEGSAALFEEAGEHDRAARAYRDAGQFADAARCFELIYDYGNALECWREVGDSEREMAMLEKLGEYMDAAEIARELGDRDAALHHLQQIEPRHHLHPEACRKIAEMASEFGDHDLAVAKFEEGIAVTGVEGASVETLESYAAVLERAGRDQQAIEALEAIRRRDASRTDVVPRIQALKQKASQSNAMTQQIATDAPPPAVETRYELVEEIGRGGMGVVYKARDKRLGRVVALKRLPENLRDHPAAVELFEREARAAASLNHVNIVTVYDAGEEDGSFFITMELLEGRPLNAILERNGRVGVRDTMRLGVQICAGLQYAHARKIVHRDIKTANLFFTNDQVVKIMDFGIAKSLEEVRRSTTVVGGTPYYMSPEQAGGEDVDHRTDLYALGVTFFQLVTGHLPFEDGDVAYMHRHEPPPDPRELSVEVPAELARLILQLMEKSPDARPESAAAVGTRLGELLAQK